MSIEEIQEYKTLHDELMRGHMFVVPDWTDPRWQRFNELSGKVQKLYQRVNNHHP